MLETPIETLGEGYPLPTEKARKETAPIWERAFEIHSTAHIGDNRFHEGRILPIRASESNTYKSYYCDCYIRAWLELNDPAYIEKMKRIKRRKELRAQIEEKRLQERLFYAQPEFYERVI